jgi:hypothetical protein
VTDMSDIGGNEGLNASRSRGGGEAALTSRPPAANPPALVAKPGGGGEQDLRQVTDRRTASSSQAQQLGLEAAAARRARSASEESEELDLAAVAEGKALDGLGGEACPGRHGSGEDTQRERPTDGGEEAQQLDLEAAAAAPSEQAQQRDLEVAAARRACTRSASEDSLDLAAAMEGEALDEILGSDEGPGGHESGEDTREVRPTDGGGGVSAPRALSSAPALAPQGEGAGMGGRKDGAPPPAQFCGGGEDAAGPADDNMLPPGGCDDVDDGGGDSDVALLRDSDLESQC